MDELIMFFAENGSIGSDKEVLQPNGNVMEKNKDFSCKEENSNGKDSSPKESNLHGRY